MERLVSSEQTQPIASQAPDTPSNSSMNCGTKRSKLNLPSSASISFPESGMSEGRDCVVKLVAHRSVGAKAREKSDRA